MANKKIDVITKYFHPVVAGIETNVQNVYGYMVPHGWNVTIHTVNGTPEAPHSLPPTAMLRGLKIRRYPWHWWGYAPEVDWEHTGLLALHNFDVFPHSWILLLVLSRRVLGLSTPKVFLTPHGGYTPEWRIFPPHLRFIKRLYHKTLGRFLINSVCSGCRSVSEREAEETIQYGVNPKLVQVIRNGLEAEVYTDIEKLASSEMKSIVKKLGVYLIQIGRIHPIKNQLTTIKALTLLPTYISFVIAGPVEDAGYDQKLKKGVVELGLEKRVHFLGVISGIDKYYLYRKSAVNTHMAIWESYCNALHEAMSQGCVCVIAKDTASVELIKDGKNGFTVGEYDYQSVAEKVKFILDPKNKHAVDEMRKNNINYTKGHSWQEISNEVERVYTHVINS